MPAIPAPFADDEAERLASLHAIGILDTLPEQVYDDVVQLASQICGAPIALVSLVDAERQWFKARVGLGVSETHRDLAFCAHAIVAPEPLFVVEDTTRDARFADNPLVTGDPRIRFYAGVPIVMDDGQALGTVCVIDTVPRVLDAGQLASLRALSRQTAALLELRLRTAESERQARELERLSNEAIEQRRRSAELLALVLRGGNLGMWELDVPTGRFTASDRELDMLGYAEEPDAAEFDWKDLIHPEDWPVLKGAMARHVTGELDHYACEHRMRHRDGHWIWVLDHAVAVERDAAGKPVRVVGTHMDVTSLVDSRLALQHARELLQRTGSLARIGGWELEIGTGRISWTDEVYRIHELDPSTPPALVDALAFYPPEARLVLRAALDAAMRDGTPWDLELPFVTARGRALMVRAQGEGDAIDGKVRRLFGTFQDVTERHRAEQAVIESQRLLRTVTDNLPALIAHIDHEQRYRFLNGHIRRVFGTDTDAAIGRTMREVRGEATYAQLAPHVEAALRGEKTSFAYVEKSNGRETHFRSDYIPDIDEQGRVRGFHAVTFDITALHETQRQLEALARVDSLTGLPNRRQFDERIEQALLRARRHKQPLGLMFLDIDRFKSINDSLGHAIGDEVLREFANRLRACLRATDTVARLAGDEFVVLLEGVGGAHELGSLADKVVSCIRPAFHVGGTALEVTTSIGAATDFGDDLGATELLARADEALYRAKKLGRNRYALA